MSQWKKICNTAELLADTGLCAKGSEDQQIAIFFEKKSQQLFAIDNHCPFSKANVLSRGLMAELNGVLTVASPIYKQHFDLKTGQCLEDENVNVDTFQIRENAGNIEVLL